MQLQAVFPAYLYTKVAMVSILEQSYRLLQCSVEQTSNGFNSTNYMYLIIFGTL